MKLSLAAFLFALLASCPASAACDELVSKILFANLKPAIEDADCLPAPLDNKDHKLNRVCYESSGPTSHITIDTTLHCHDSDESVGSHILGRRNQASVSDNVTVEANARGSDCSVIDVHVKPSGELTKIAAKIFDADGKARKALEKGLAEACKN